jgi:hypothetical protein
MLNFGKVGAKNLARISELWDLAKDNPTLRALFKKLDGTNAKEAYIILKNMDDNELRLLAALIGQANSKFERKG